MGRLVVGLYREQIVMTKWGILVGETIFTGDWRHLPTAGIGSGYSAKVVLLRVDSILPARYVREGFAARRR
jgi:hypothetical protein